MVRSAFGDLVFPCRTECPDGPIRKLKNGVIIGAVSVPLAASRSQYRFSRDQDDRIQSNGVSAAPCLPAEGQEPSASRNAGKAWSGKGVALLHSKSYRSSSKKKLSRSGNRVPAGELLFLSLANTFPPASARFFRVAAVSLIRRRDDGLVHHCTEMI